MAKTPKTTAPAEADASAVSNDEMVEAAMAKLFGEMAPEPKAEEAAEPAAAGEPVAFAHDLEPVRDDKIDLESALSRLSTMRRPDGKWISPIAIAGFDAQETKAQRGRDTWENYHARFVALMNARG